MSEIIGRLAAKLDGHRFEQIVGIPRGGLIVAAALGYRLGVTEVAAFCERYTRRPGTDVPIVGRLYCGPVPGQVRGRRLLVVEDGVRTGTLLAGAADWLRHYVGDSGDVTTAALWVSKGATYRPDVWVEEVDTLPSGASLLCA